MAYAGRLRLSGLKSELVKDRYVVLSTVTMTSLNRTAKHKKPTRQKQPKHKNTKTQPKQNTKQKTNPHEKSSNVTGTSSWVKAVN